jgi:DNA-directed RNA polymerase subunit RPC12/RpoP
MERFDATIAIRGTGRQFCFELYGRQLDFTDVGGPKLKYYWMDTRQLRMKRSANQRACVDFWWAAMESEGLASYGPSATAEEKQVVTNNQLNLMLADLYPLVCTSKGRQQIFRDAFPRRVPAEVDEYGDVEYPLNILNEDEAKRLRAVGCSRDMDAIRAEVQDALVGELPAAAQKRAVKQAFHRWSVNGVIAWQTGGRAALQQYLETQLRARLQEYRRRGGEGTALLRQFINMVIYESKVAFNTCFANAWRGLIPWLEKYRQLDRRSKHLLAFWHRQQLNPDVELPFWGHVLSLHPISAWFMTQMPHRLALARYLNSVANTEPRWDLDNRQNAAYWELVGSILVAIREYVTHVNVVETHRKSVGGAQVNVEEAAERSQEFSERLVFDELLGHRRARCPKCEFQEAEFIDREVLSEADQQLRVNYRCRACGSEFDLKVNGDELRQMGRESEVDARSD